MANTKSRPCLRMASGGSMDLVDAIPPSSLSQPMGIQRGMSVGANRILADERASLRKDATDRYGIDTQARTADLTSGRQLEGVKYGSDQDLIGRKYGADKSLAAAQLSADASRYGADQQLAGTRTSADAAKYGYDTQLLGQRMQARGVFGGAGGAGGTGSGGYGNTNTFDPGAFYDAIPTGFRSAELLAQGRPQSQQNLYPYGRFGELMPGAYGTYDTLTGFNGQPLRRQDGGEVPGQGKGDKIPALYEPGEFVVSNDMLKKAPGLREQLHELREETLADKGMTPAEADAKALRGLRVHALDGIDVTEIFNTNVDPEKPGWGSDEARRWQSERNANSGPQRPAGASAKAAGETPNEWARRVYGEAGEKATNLRESAKRVMNNPTAKGAVRFIGIAAGADQARQAYEAAEAGENINALDHALTGVASAVWHPAGLAYLGGHLAGDQLINRNMDDTQREGVGYAVNKLVRGAGKMFGQDWGVSEAQEARMHEAGMPIPDSTPSLRNKTTPKEATVGPQDYTEQMAALQAELDKTRGGKTEQPVVKTVDENGNVSYSGGSGTAGLRNPISVIPGMSKAQIDAVLTNPNGTRWSENDNAIMAANLRDGVDPYRGTSRGTGPLSATYNVDGHGLLSDAARERRNLMMEITSSDPNRAAAGMATLKAMEEGKLKEKELAAAKEIKNAENRVSMRGQDMVLEGHKYTADSTARTARANAQIEAFYKNREWDRNVDKDNWERGQKGRENFVKMAETMFRDPSDPSKPDMKHVAEFSRTTDVTLQRLLPKLEASPDAKDQEMAKAIRARDYGALSQPMIAALQRGYAARQAHANSYNVPIFGSDGRLSDDLFSYTNPKLVPGMIQNRMEYPNGVTIPQNVVEQGTIIPHFGIRRELVQ